MVFHFIINKFYLIEIKTLHSHQEKAYIEFLVEFSDKIDIEFNGLINSIFQNISWIDNIKNFFLLEKINKSSYKKFVKANELDLKERIHNTFEKEIE